ncbi:MAG: hypothetical protein ACI9W4_001210 [Rhodothermales bacterium]|jgi:hypothetical protein
MNIMRHRPTRSQDRLKEPSGPELAVDAFVLRQQVRCRDGEILPKDSVDSNQSKHLLTIQGANVIQRNAQEIHHGVVNDTLSEVPLSLLLVQDDHCERLDKLLELANEVVFGEHGLGLGAEVCLSTKRLLPVQDVQRLVALRRVPETGFEVLCVVAVRYRKEQQKWRLYANWVC